MLVQEAAFATDVPPNIYAFHRYTRNSTHLYRILVTTVSIQGAAFATGIPPHLYAFHRYTWNSTPLYRTLACQYEMQFQG